MDQLRGPRHRLAIADLVSCIHLLCGSLFPSLGPFHHTVHQSHTTGPQEQVREVSRRADEDAVSLNDLIHAERRD